MMATRSRDHRAHRWSRVPVLCRFSWKGLLCLCIANLLVYLIISRHNPCTAEVWAVMITHPCSVHQKTSCFECNDVDVASSIQDSVVHCFRVAHCMHKRWALTSFK
jgi:hypothetical protein